MMMPGVVSKWMASLMHLDVERRSERERESEGERTVRTSHCAGDGRPLRTRFRLSASRDHREFRPFALSPFRPFAA